MFSNKTAYSYAKYLQIRLHIFGYFFLGPNLPENVEQFAGVYILRGFVPTRLASQEDYPINAERCVQHLLSERLRLSA